MPRNNETPPPCWPDDQLFEQPSGDLDLVIVFRPGSQIIGDRWDGLARDVEPAVGVFGDNEVHFHGRVEMRVVGTLVGAAALAPLSGAEEAGLGSDEGGAQVEGVR